MLSRHHPGVTHAPGSSGAVALWVLDEPVLANRILANEGVLDAFGHISIRHPDDAGRYVISRSLAPELVTEADLQEFKNDREQVHGSEAAAYAEQAIHGAIYEARPDVLAVCHNHAPSTIPFSVTARPRRPMLHGAGLLGSAVPVWDPRDEFGDTDMLVRTLAQGRSLARTLANGRVALMRGHGGIVAGASLKRGRHVLRLHASQRAASARGGEASRQCELPVATAKSRAPPSGFSGRWCSQRAWEAWSSRVALS